jgi:hypothetical protein
VPLGANVEVSVTTGNLVGHWRDENSEFWLFETGDYRMSYVNGKSVKGTWKAVDGQLLLYKDRLFGASEKVFTILLFTKQKFVYQSLNKKSDTFTAVKVEPK